MLTTVPSLRIGCGAADGEEIKSHPFFHELNWAEVEAKQLQPEFVPTASDCVKPTDEELELDSFEEKEGVCKPVTWANIDSLVVKWRGY